MSDVNLYNSTDWWGKDADQGKIQHNPWIHHIDAWSVAWILEITHTHALGESSWSTCSIAVPWKINSVPEATRRSKMYVVRLEQGVRGIKGSVELAARDDQRSLSQLGSWAEESNPISRGWNIWYHGEKDGTLFWDQSPAINLSRLLCCMLWVFACGTLHIGEALPLHINPCMDPVGCLSRMYRTDRQWWLVTRFCEWNSPTNLTCSDFLSSCCE